MDAVISDSDWSLISPKSKKVIKVIPARKLWVQILETRVTTGAPYILFKDIVNRLAPEEYKHEQIEITTSNLCSEIVLRTDDTHSGVCCLGSINLEYWDEYQNNFDEFIADCSDFLDNVLQDFIDRTKHMPGFEKARASAIDERSLGLGVMGLHSLFQSKMIPFESPMAKGLNLHIFQKIKESADKHNTFMRTAVCPMSTRNGTFKRNIHVTAIAPTMSISNLCNLASGGIEPWVTNTFTKKLKQGSFAVRNKYLHTWLINYAVSLEDRIKTPLLNWVDDQWASIQKNNGSIQHLDWMDQNTKDVFKTAFEIDQKWVIELAGDRAQHIDQSQSVNLFIAGNSHVQRLSDLHIMAWKKGLKSLYYLRSSAVNRGSTSSDDRKQIQLQEVTMDTLTSDSCVGCA
jgi:ribonucleoside-diphosphate reductase alpha chain